jgi:hypothetical protein
VAWSNTWGPEHDAALRLLPEMERCSHDLFARLARNPSAAKKRFAIVSRDDTPVAVVALRKRQSFWEPVTEAAVPWCLFPALPGDHAAVLQTLNLRVQCIRDVHPEDLNPDEVHPYTVHRAHLSDDIEAYWHKSRHDKTVRAARRKTEDLTVRTNQPGDMEWVVASWVENWKGDRDEQGLAGPDCLLAGLELQRLGEYHVVALADGDELVAGATLYVRSGLMGGQIFTWDRSRAKQWVGTRLMDECFNLARDLGCDTFDLGGVSDYKEKWAPADGERYFAIFKPRPGLLRRTRALASRARRRLGFRAVAALLPVSEALGGNLVNIPSHTLSLAVGG